MGERPGAVEGVAVIDKSFWRGRRVLVTGHTGFKGGWLSLWLESLGAEVTGYALAPNTSPSLYEAANVARGLKESVIADIRDLVRLGDVIRRARPEIVIHMAAQPLVRASYADPIETYSVNVLGTATLLEAVRHAGGVRTVVNVTSDKCYENREWVWGYRESDPMGGFDPYSSSKGCAELVTAAMRSSFFHPESWSEHKVAVASARAGNVIGGGDWAEDRLVPDLVRAFTAGLPAPVRRPEAIRPWQHVLEPLSGYLVLAERLVDEGPAYADAWNFGPEDSDAREVGWLADHVSRLWGEGARCEGDRRAHPHEATFLKLDCSKARARLGWKPRWHLERALEETVGWYRAFYTGSDVRALSLAQIAAYSTRVGPRGAGQ
ncbi:MAG: CDP-glucose 4,6-dehydratase [Betaproteobacteria bacterium RBG_16_64_18]|nr:MAG: CDP-glucose 4,6-dehydratase [Betaproteobacteria bacterium RBG_16_64_18]